MKNWFDTLNEALESENLLETWDIHYLPIQYGETRSYAWDIPQSGKPRPYTSTIYISIYRNEQGKYERPIHYSIV